MSSQTGIAAAQVVVQVCLILVSAIALIGGSLQLYVGEPDTSPRLDNVHRFMAGVYLSTGFICLWAAITIREQGFLIYLLALGVFLGATGRLISIRKVGMPEPKGRWLGYLIPELSIPIIMVVAQYLRR